MSILYDANTKAHHIPAASSIDSLEAMTVIAWYNVTNVGAAVHNLISKQVSGAGVTLFRPSGASGPDDWKFKRFRATTNSEIISTGNIVQVGRWEFIAVADDTSAVPDMIHGTLTARPTKPSIFSSLKGVGAVKNDSANNLYVANRNILDQTAHVHLGFIGIWNRRMTVAQMQAQWQRPHCNDGCVLFAFPGLHGSTKLIDLSGNKNNGVLDGAPTWSAPPPLPFGLSGHRRRIIAFDQPSSPDLVNYYLDSEVAACPIGQYCSAGVTAATTSKTRVCTTQPTNLPNTPTALLLTIQKSVIIPGTWALMYELPAGADGFTGWNGFNAWQVSLHSHSTFPGGADVYLEDIHICKVDAACVNQQSLASTTGIHHNFAVNEQFDQPMFNNNDFTLSSTDKIVVIFTLHNTGTINENSWFQTQRSSDVAGFVLAPLSNIPRGGDTFFENRHPIEYGMKPDTAAGMQGVLIA